MVTSKPKQQSISIPKEECVDVVGQELWGASPARLASRLRSNAIHAQTYMLAQRVFMGADL